MLPIGLNGRLRIMHGALLGGVMNGLQVDVGIVVVNANHFCLNLIQFGISLKKAVQLVGSLNWLQVKLGGFL